MLASRTCSKMVLVAVASDSHLRLGFRFGKPAPRPLLRERIHRRDTAILAFDRTQKATYNLTVYLDQLEALHKPSDAAH